MIFKHNAINTKILCKELWCCTRREKGLLCFSEDVVPVYVSWLTGEFGCLWWIVKVLLFVPLKYSCCLTNRLTGTWYSSLLWTLCTADHHCHFSHWNGLCVFFTCNCYFSSKNLVRYASQLSCCLVLNQRALGGAHTSAMPRIISKLFLNFVTVSPQLCNILFTNSQQGSHWSWKVLKSPEIWLFIFQDLKSPEIGHGCWKSHEKVLIFASVILKNQDTESVTM